MKNSCRNGEGPLKRQRIRGTKSYSSPPNTGSLHKRYTLMIERIRLPQRHFEKKLVPYIRWDLRTYLSLTLLQTNDNHQSATIAGMEDQSGNMSLQSVTDCKVIYYLHGLSRTLKVKGIFHVLFYSVTLSFFLAVQRPQINRTFLRAQR